MFSTCFGNLFIFQFLIPKKLTPCKFLEKKTVLTILKLDLLRVLYIFTEGPKIRLVVLILKFRFRRDLQNLQDYTPLPEIKSMIERLSFQLSFKLVIISHAAHCVSNLSCVDYFLY